MGIFILFTLTQHVPSAELNGMLPLVPCIKTSMSSPMATGKGMTHCPTAFTWEGPEVGVVIVVVSAIVSKVDIGLLLVLNLYRLPVF